MTEHSLTGGRREGLISLSSLSETQERSIADKSAYASIDTYNDLSAMDLSWVSLKLDSEMSPSLLPPVSEGSVVARGYGP